MNEGDQCKRLSHEFEMAKMKSLISGLEDIDEVKALAHHLIDLLDGANMMLATMIEEEALKKSTNKNASYEGGNFVFSNLSSSLNCFASDVETFLRVALKRSAN